MTPDEEKGLGAECDLWFTITHRMLNGERLCDLEEEFKDEIKQVGLNDVNGRTIEASTL